MTTNSKIEWTHHTFNPWRGCTKVSEGCKNCYAETMSKRNPSVLGIWGKQGQRSMAAESYWRQPVKWNREAQEAGERRRVFCASLADVFEGPDTMPTGQYSDVRNARARLFKLIEDTPHLDWLLLTKRPENVEWQVLELYRDCLVKPSPWPLPNVWLGTSVEDQDTANERIPHLLRCPAAVRWLSMEPLLGPVNLGEIEMWWTRETGALPEGEAPKPDIDWVVVGGESGAGARPMHPDWARSIRSQCVAASVPFFFKQWGEWVEHAYSGQNCPHCGAENCLHRQKVGDAVMLKVGKKAAGRELDGRTWDEYPTPEPQPA